MADVDALVDAGIVTVVAREIGRQIDVTAGNPGRLAGLGVAPESAIVLSRTINGQGSIRALLAVGWTPAQAVEIMSQINGGGYPPPITPGASWLTASNGDIWLVGGIPIYVIGAQ